MYILNIYVICIYITNLSAKPMVVTNIAKSESHIHMHNTHAHARTCLPCFRSGYRSGRSIDTSCFHMGTNMCVIYMS